MKLEPMNEASNGWQLPPETWNRLCQELEPVTAVDRPYERIRVSDSADREGLMAFVEEPFPDPPDPPEQHTDGQRLFQSGDWVLDGSTNDATSLSPGLVEDIWAVINRLHSSGLTITNEAISVDLETSLFTSTKSVAVFSLERSLSADEAGLYTQFRELMVTLGHADDPDTITHGYDLAPQADDISNNEWDFGIGATAYRLVPDPHSYWANCETLAEYIDMCVENGADRAELEARDLYYHHFHPTTASRNLTAAEEAAVAAWQENLRTMFVPSLVLGDGVIRHYLSNARFVEDGTGSLGYSVVVGDAIFEGE